MPDAQGSLSIYHEDLEVLKSIQDKILQSGCCHHEGGAPDCNVYDSHKMLHVFFFGDGNCQKTWDFIIDNKELFDDTLIEGNAYEPISLYAEVVMKDKNDDFRIEKIEDWDAKKAYKMLMAMNCVEDFLNDDTIENVRAKMPELANMYSA